MDDWFAETEDESGTLIVSSDAGGSTIRFYPHQRRVGQREAPTFVKDLDPKAAERLRDHLLAAYPRNYHP